MATQSRIVDVHGNPLSLADVKVPQTSEYSNLHREWQGHPSRGLKPSKLAAILVDAEQGNPMAQFELFDDMEERDAHIMSEMGKRRRAVTGLDWSIVPPPNASAAERDTAVMLNELIAGLDEFENVLFDATDAIGKGFECQEIEWARTGGLWLPKTVQHRPQTWFELQRGFTEKIVLRTPEGGQALQPFGWLVHTHKAKSGYLDRSALFRVLVWPYLFKNYSVGDLAEFLEIYGIPLRLGKYPGGATPTEKSTLLRALSQIGHNAAGIIPQGMEIEFHNAATGDPAAFDSMIGWCERSQSKAILGGTLTSQADGKTSTNALGNVHNEVRRELLEGDAKQIAVSISRDLIYPIAMLNGLVTDWARCPRLRFDLNEPEDMGAMATALPAFVSLGMKISRQWAQERVGIPEPEDDEDILGMPAQPAVDPSVDPQADPKADAKEVKEKPDDTKPTAALNRQSTGPAKTLTDSLDDRLQPITGQWIERIRQLVNGADSLDQIRDGLATLLPEMTLQQYADVMAEALRLAELNGRADIMAEANNAN